MTNTLKPGPRLTFDKQWTKPTGQRDGAGPFTSDIVNEIGEKVGYRQWMFGLRPRMPVGGIVKRILVRMQFRKVDSSITWVLPKPPPMPLHIASDKPPPGVNWNARFPVRKERGPSILDSLRARIVTHIIPLADLFEHQKPATFRGWTKACLDHFLRRHREADQEAANADHKPVFLEADRATVEVRRLRPRVGELPFQTATAETAAAVAAALPPSKQNLSALKDRASTILPLLKGNEVTVFEALQSNQVTNQRDIANATGLTEGAVSKILDRIIKKAG